MSCAASPGHVRDLAEALANGSLTAEALVRRCLDRIAEVDGQVKAWVHVLADEAIATARARRLELLAAFDAGGTPFATAAE